MQVCQRKWHPHTHRVVSGSNGVMGSWRSHTYTKKKCHTYTRWGSFSTNLSPSGRIRQVQNTTSCHNSGTMNLNSIRISTVRGHAPYKYPPRNTMPKNPGINTNPLRISWSDTSFSPMDIQEVVIDSHCVIGPWRSHTYTKKKNVTHAQGVIIDSMW